MDIKAAVLDAMGAESPYAASKPLTIETLQLDAPGPGEILVRIEAAGLCHSDLSVINGNWPRPMPMALGHEAAGIVEEVGPAVGGAGGADLRPGDHVVFVFVPSCGHCEPCDELQATGATRADRGRLLDETLDVFDAVWGPDPVTFRGPRVVIDNASVLPKPVSKIPVMLAAVAATWAAAPVPKPSSALPNAQTAGCRYLPLPGQPEPQNCAQAGTVSGKWLLVDQVMDDVRTAAEAGTDELIVDLNLQDWFTSTRQMLETAVEIRERAVAS